MRSVLKMVVSWRSPWPCEKSQKMAMQLSSESVACVIFLCWRRIWVNSNIAKYLELGRDV